MNQRHCPSYANRSEVRVLGAALDEPKGYEGGTWLIVQERPLE